MTIRKHNTTRVRIVQAQLAATRQVLLTVEAEKKAIEGEIASLEAQLRGMGISAKAAGLVSVKNQKDYLPAAAQRTMSAATRRSIATSQKERWAEFRRQKAKQSAADKPPVPKKARKASLKAASSAPFRQVSPASAATLEDEMRDLVAHE